MTDIKHPIYRALAGEINRLQTLRENFMGYYKPEAAYDVKADIQSFVNNHFPSGSGFDGGTKIDLTITPPNKLVFFTMFHHMDENSSYCGWTNHTVIVTPDLFMGFNVRVTGKELKRGDDIKSYIAECFSNVLTEEIPAYSISPVKASKDA